MNKKQHIQTKNFKEIEYPIVSHPYGEKFSSSLYKMHRFWGRKPPNVIAEYVQKYCPKNGIVLDPFLGSGTTAIEAIRLGRRVIGIDINPLAIFIAKTTLTPVRLPLLEKAFRSVIEKTSPMIAPWYETFCTRCGKRAYLSYVVHAGDNTDNLEIEVPTQISYRCSCSPRLLFKDPDKRDKKLIHQSRTIKITDWYPNDLILPQIRPGDREAKTIRDLYTIRNLYSLSKIYAEISKIDNEPVKNCLLLAFSSALPQCSRLSGVDKRLNDRVSAMGWILTSFRVMREHVERNPLESLSFAFRRVLKGKIEANNTLTSYSEARTIDAVFHGNATAFIKQASVNDLPYILNGNRVNYVFADPPHGPSIQFMKLSSLSNAWLKLESNSEEEIIQETLHATSRYEYEKKLQDGFKALKYVISERARIHVYFRARKEEQWIDAARTILRGGYSLIRSVFQPQRYGFRTTFRGRQGWTAKSLPPGDWILHLTPDKQDKENIPDIRAIEKEIVKQTEYIIKKRGQPTRTKYILMNVVTKIPSSLLEKNPDIIINTLEKNLGDKFLKNEVGSDVFWSLVDMKKTDPPLISKVEEVVSKALIGREAVGSTRTYLYQAIYSSFPSVLTPDQNDIESVLNKVTVRKRGEDENLLYLSDEYIRKRDIHSEIILCLSKIGVKHGFQIYISPKAIKRISKSKLMEEWVKLGDNILSSDKISFNNSPAQFANVLWIKRNKVHAHFEVEDRIDINEATFIRGEEVRKLWHGSERVLVLPHKLLTPISQTLREKNTFWHVAPFHAIFLSDDDRKTYHKPIEPQKLHAPANARPLNLKVNSKEDIFDSDGNIVSFKLKLDCPSDVLKLIRPGHFLQIGINEFSRNYLSKYKAGNSYSSLKRSPTGHPENLDFLRIPISIHRVYHDNFEPSSLADRSRDFLPPLFWEWIRPGEMKYIDLLIRLVGRGTRTLYNLKKGDNVNVIGPLGKSIEFPPDFDNAILVSGGVGLASLYPIAHHLRMRGYGIKLFAGARDRRTLEDKDGRLLPDFKEMGVECYVTDEVNDKKFVTTLLSEWLNSKEDAQLSECFRIYSCGPWPMLKEVHKIALKWNLPCTVLANKLVLCGVGACMSCVVKTWKRSEDPKGNQEPSIEMVRSCVNGPAFESRDIIWD